MVPAPSSGTRLAAACALLILVWAVPAAAQYGGMGGFGGMGTGMGGGGADSNASNQSPRLSFRPWLSANGTYTDTLAPSSSVSRQPYHSLGYGAAAGVSGGKGWSRTVLGGYYTANYQRYSQRTYRGGLNQVGGLVVRHSLTDRLSLFATQFAGSSNGGYGYGSPAGTFGGWGFAGSGVLADLAPGGLGFGDQASNGLVDNEAFNTRVNYYGSSGGFSYNPSMRWTFGATATGSIVRRSGQGLSGLNSVSTGGYAAYRFSQRSQLASFYQYGRFSYPQLFGGNQVQHLGLQYHYQLSQQTFFMLGAGGYRFQTTAVGRFAMDSELAGLLGQSSVLQVFETKYLGWSGNAGLMRSWHRWSWNTRYDHGVSPGNGFMLAAKRDAATTNATMSLGGVYLGGYASYYRMSGIIQRGAKTDSITIGGNFGARILADLYFGANGGYSNYETNTSARQWRRFISVHLTWSPADAAFRF